MTRDALEVAISTLTALMDADCEEAAFQDFFEQHPIVFDVLGYSPAIPHPVLPLPDNQRYIPDFLGQRVDGLSDVIDLKLPSARVLLGRERREAMTAAMNAHIGQMRDYQDWFNESANREHVRGAYGLEVPVRPRALLIAGRTADIDRAELHRQLVDRPNIAVQTFDDILVALHAEYARHHGRWEDIGGVSAHLLVRLRRGEQHRDRYVFELESGDGIRVGLCVTPNEQLVLRVRSADGTVVEAAAGGVDYDVWTPVACTIGGLGDETLVQLRLDDIVVAEQVVRGFTPLPENPVGEITLGADRDGSHGGVVDMKVYLLRDRLLGFQDRMAVTDHLRLQSARDGSYVEFGGAQWLATDGGESALSRTERS